MTGPAATGAAPALRYDAWFDSPWGRYACRIDRAWSPRRIADIGCGTGRLLRILTSRGASAVGLDTDPAMLTLAATRGTVASADAHRLPLTDGSMDATVTVATLEFTADPARVLAEMARVTRPGGRLVAAVLNPASPWGILDRPARRPPYTSAYSPAQTCSPWAAGTARPASTEPCSRPATCPHSGYLGQYWRQPGSSPRGSAPSRSSPCTPET